MIKVSVVSPAFNETTLLSRLLDSVDAARAYPAHGPDSVEAIVADNMSTDGTGVRGD